MSVTMHDIDQPPAVTSLRSKDLLGISDLTPDEMTQRAERAMKQG